jgi:hypothetical protein
MIRGLLTSQPDTRWTSVTALQHMVDTYNIAESIAAIKLMNETTPSVAVDSLLQVGGISYHNSYEMLQLTCKLDFTQAS